MLAAEGGALATLDAVKTLLEHGAKVNAVNKAGQTALMLAASGPGSEYAAMTDLLLKWGADAEIRDKHGDTASDIRQRSEREEAGTTPKATEKQ